MEIDFILDKEYVCIMLIEFLKFGRMASFKVVPVTKVRKRRKLSMKDVGSNPSKNPCRDCWIDFRQRVLIEETKSK